MSAAADDKEDVKERLLKVLRLAQQGIGGERENAEALLEKLLRKHSMSITDLEDIANPPRTCVWLPASDEDERTVLSQLIISLFGAERKVWTRAGEMNAGVDVRPSEHAALVIAWDVYRPAFAEARRALVMGFCFRHGLYVTEGASTAVMTPEARERANRAIAMAETLPTVEAPARRLN